MNLSGQCIKEVIRYGISLQDLIILQDDKDLELGIGRLREEGSDGGHNGIKSIIEETGTDLFTRLRLGIAPFSRPLDQFVLGSWTPSEMETIRGMQESFNRFMKLIDSPIEIQKIINQVNTRGFWGESVS
jgi:PTH1 family peptidyl-tRNA hydrolase